MRKECIKEIIFTLIRINLNVKIYLVICLIVYIIVAGRTLITHLKMMEYVINCSKLGCAYGCCCSFSSAEGRAARAILIGEEQACK